MREREEKKEEGSGSAATNNEPEVEWIIRLLSFAGFGRSTLQSTASQSGIRFILKRKEEETILHTLKRQKQIQNIVRI